MTLQGRIYTISKQGQELDANAKFLSMIQESVDNDVVVIDGRNIAAGSIYASQIHANAITADHLRADAITSDHITAGVITGDKITSGVIRSQDNSMEIDLNNGTINLSKPLVIDSKRVATEEFVETNLADTIKSIEIGGVNLLKGTKDLNTDNFQRTTTLEIRQDEDIPYLRSSGTTSDYYIIELEPNATYTLSLDIRNFVSGSGSILLQWYSSLTSTRISYEWADIPNANITSEWKRFNATFTVPANNNFFSIGFRMADFRLFKLEKGNISTDWTEAPEDTQAKINERPTFDDFVKTDKVTIDGGNITAGTISSENNYSRINLDDGTFSFGNGRLVWNGSDMTVNGKISVNNIDGDIPKSKLESSVRTEISAGSAAKSTLDSKSSAWDAKETTTGAQEKATAAEKNAKKYVDDNTGNLVNNPAATGNHTGWTGSGLSSLNQTFEGVSTRVIQTLTDSNVQYYSSYFKVDPSKAYEVSAWFKKSVANASGYYLGLNGINASGSSVGFVRTSQSGGVVSANDSNFYFEYGTAPTEWVKVVGYIMPVGTKPSDLNGLGTRDNAIMKQNIDRIRVRFLNWNNGGTTRELWVANPKVVEVDPNAIIYSASAKMRTDAWSWNGTTEIDGTSIRTRTITANEIKSKTITTEELNITTLSAITANLGTVTAGTIRSSDNAININLDTGTINLSRPLTINSLPVSTKKEVDDAIGNIEVGGRNLLSSSSANNVLPKLAFNNVGALIRLSFSYLEDYMKIAVNTTSTFNNHYQFGSTSADDEQGFENDQMYTFSALIFIPSSNVMNINPHVRFLGSVNNVWIENNEFFDTTERDRWVRVVATLKFPDNSVGKMFRIVFQNNNNGDWFGIKNLKLEKGNIATDWTEAPEDTQAKLDAQDDETQSIKDDLNKYVEVSGYDDKIGEITTALSNYLSALKETNNAVYGLRDEDGNLIVDIVDGEEVPRQGGAMHELNTLLNKTSAIEQNLFDQTQTWNFNVSKIVMGDEGMFIGDENGTMGIRISPGKPETETQVAVAPRIDFVDGETIVAYISGTMMRINRAMFVESITIGEHEITTISGGHTIWQWVNL